MKKIGVALLVTVLLITGIAVSYRLAAVRYESQIAVLKGEVAIYKNEAEKYAGLLRTIRETASSATVVEKAP